jgi:type II secretory pathway pseudopilin PulG
MARLLSTTGPKNDAGSRVRGVGLIEALVALLVVSFATVLTTRLQTQLRRESDIAQQRAEAAQLARAELEGLRAPWPSVERSGEFISGSGDATIFKVEHRATPLPGRGAQRVEVAVDWLDRAGSARRLALDSIIADADPAHSGALGLTRGGAAIGAIGRSPRIPLRAVDLGDGRSAFKPIENERVAIVFDNLDGAVLDHCGWVDPTLATSDLRADRLGPCVSMGGRLISGVVRFAAATPPDPARGFDPPLPFELHLQLGRGKYLAPPACITDAVTAGPDRHATYHCTVFPRADGRWSGRLDLVPKGWALGTARGAWRVCRYVNDLDGDGTIRANLEHPANYIAVASNLANQNFLLIDGEKLCPGFPATGPATDNRLPVPFPATEPHQP